MPGRRHVAAPGEPACGVDGCERPAGFATSQPGSGPCRRHGGAVEEPTPAPSRTLPAVPLVRRTGAAAEAARRRLRGDGRPTPKPLALVGVILAAGRRAGFPFEEAWEVAAVTALGYMSERRADDWADVLDSTRAAWEDAYHDRRSPLAVLPREVPPAEGVSEPMRKLGLHEFVH